MRVAVLGIAIISTMLAVVGHQIGISAPASLDTREPQPPRGANQSRVKVLTVAMFEIGAPTGDAPGEAQLWIEGEKLNQVIQIPGSYSPMYCNSVRDHCLVITGIGTANATATIMAVGLSNQLDLSKAYIMVAGIAGTPPDQGTLGTAAWANWVVDGDVAHEIDAREMPKDWSYPYFPFGCNQPQCNHPQKVGTEVFLLNSSLTNRAYQLSKDLPLADSQQAQAYRSNYPNGTAARRKPFVTRCDSLAASTYWHGRLLSNWAKSWTKELTGGQGNYCMSNMEESGTLTALTRLAAMGRVDINRVMVLRTASNFDQPHPGQTAQQSVQVNSGGYLPAVQNAYRVGSVVTRYIINHWQQWQNGVPVQPAK